MNIQIGFKLLFLLEYPKTKPKNVNIDGSVYKINMKRYFEMQVYFNTYYQIYSTCYTIALNSFKCKCIPNRKKMCKFIYSWKVLYNCYEQCASKENTL